MVKFEIITYLALVVAACVAQDPTAATDPTEPCTTEGEAMDKCMLDNNCKASCPEDLFSGSSTSNIDISAMSDPTDLDAAKAALQKFITDICDAGAADVCKAKKCCTACEAEVESAMACMTVEFPKLMAQSLADSTSDAENANNAITELNNLAQETFNVTETIVPTMDFASLYEGLTCDLTDACGDGSGVSSTPGGTKPPSSGAHHIGYVLADVVAAAVAVIF
jgi:hypothetical protein